MINSQYINTLLIKFAAARATRFNLVKQAGMVPPADRAATLNKELDYYGYTNASPSSILSLDPSRSSLFHLSQLLGDTTVDQLDQSWSNPDLWTQNAVDYGGMGALGALAGNRANKALTKFDYGANGVALDRSVRGLDSKGLSAYTHLLAGDGKGSTRFSVEAIPPGRLQQLRAQLTTPLMSSDTTPAKGTDQRTKAMIATLNAGAPSGPGPTGIKAPREMVQISPYQAGPPPVKAKMKLVQPDNWANTAPSKIIPPRSQGTTANMETTIPSKSKGVTGNSKDTIINTKFRPNESTMSFFNRPKALRQLGIGAALGAGGNGLKNWLYHNSLIAPASMPINVDEVGYPTESSAAKMEADRANAGR